MLVDSSDNLYVADFIDNRVQKFIPGSSIGVTVISQANGVGGSSLSDLIQPAFLLFDSNNNLYVADSGNHRVLQFPNATTPGTLIAGTGE